MYLEFLYLWICFVGLSLSISGGVYISVAELSTGAALNCYKGVLAINASEFLPNMENNVGEEYKSGCKQGCFTSVVTITTYVQGE